MSLSTSHRRSQTKSFPFAARRSARPLSESHQHRLAVPYRIEFKELGDGIGRADIRPGYFEQEED